MAEASRKRRLVLTGVLTLVVLAFDLWSKAWAWSALRNHRRITVIDDWAYFEFGFNTGAAFSLLADASYARIVFLVFSLGAIAYLVRLVTTLPTERVAPFVAIGLVLAGVLGNMHDRLFRSLDLGGGDRQYGVVDFVRVYYWPDKPWPIFNVADVALVAGVILLVLVMPRKDAAPQVPASG
jgi:signal peptidase II